MLCTIPIALCPIPLIHPHLQPFTLEPKAVIWAHRVIFRCMDNAHGNVIGCILHQYTVLHLIFGNSWRTDKGLPRTASLLTVTFFKEFTIFSISSK